MSLDKLEFSEELPVLRFQLDGAYEEGGFLKCWYSKDGVKFRTACIRTPERWSWKGNDLNLYAWDPARDARCDSAPRTECKDLSHNHRGWEHNAAQVKLRFQEWRKTVDNLSHITSPSGTWFPPPIALIVAHYLSIEPVKASIWIGN